MIDVDSAANPPKISFRASAFLPFLMIIGTLLFFAHEVDPVRRELPRFPIDSYFYQSMAHSLRSGHGPAAEWPQGPHNKYFPGFAAYWAIFTNPGTAPEDAVREYGLAQLILLGLLITALMMLGLAIFRDATIAFSYAACASAAPLVMKWGLLPMSELLASACIAAFLAAAAWLPWPPFQGIPSHRKTSQFALLCFIGSAAAATATRIESIFFWLPILLASVARKRMAWSKAAAFAIVISLPLAIWQLWLASHFAEKSAYLAEGFHAFDPRALLDLFAFQASFLLKISGVISGPWIDSMTALVTVLFWGSFFVSLRGYLGRIPLVSACGVILFWALHAFWYYRTDRYNILIMPLILICLVEGSGRLYSWKAGWRAKGGRWTLAIATAIVVPAFWIHGLDNVRLMGRVMAEQSPVSAFDNGAALRAALQRATRASGAVLTNLALPEARRLTGTVWFESPEYVEAPYATGQAAGFIAEKQVEFIALKPPAAQWLALNALEGRVEEIYSDVMVWIGRVKK